VSKVFIDYVTLLLVNMAAGYFVLADFVFRGMDAEDQKPWVPAFAIVGLVAAVFGTHMAWTWPLPGSYNSAYGEMSVLLGVLFLGGALALARRAPGAGDGSGLHALGIYAFFAGLAAILLGVRIIHLGMTNAPMLSGIGFILSGAAGVLVCPGLAVRRCGFCRFLGALLLAGAGLIWAFTAYMAIWMHMAHFAEWKPFTMR